MVYGRAKGSAVPIQPAEGKENPRHDTRPLWFSNHLEILAAASHEIGGCPAWVIMEIEAGGMASDQERKSMLINSHEFVRPKDEVERAYLESLIRADYDRCRPGDTFDDMKRRSRFSREDQGLYRNWLAVAVALSTEAANGDFLIAAE